MNETDYTSGSRAAWLSMLHTCLHELGDYAERIANAVNDMIGASGDARVHLCAATAEEA